MRGLKEFWKDSKRPSRKALIKIFLMCALTTYLLYHILQGNRGFWALMELKQVVKKETQVLHQLEKEHKTLIRRIRLLRPQNLDEDLLEERVRFVLNMAQDEEIILQEDDILAH